MSTLNVANITDGSTTVATEYVVNGSAKAWSYFNQTSHTILGSFNISSIVDNGTGLTAVAMTSGMSSVNWAVSVTGTAASTAFGHAVTDSELFQGVGTKPYRTTTTFNIRGSDGSSSYIDHPDLSTAAFGDLA